MVLTSSSCNLGIDNFDSRQVPIISFRIAEWIPYHLQNIKYLTKSGYFEIYTDWIDRYYKTWDSKEILNWFDEVVMRYSILIHAVFFINKSLNYM